MTILTCFGAVFLGFCVGVMVSILAIGVGKAERDYERIQDAYKEGYERGKMEGMYGL